MVVCLWLCLVVLVWGIIKINEHLIMVSPRSYLTVSVVFLVGTLFNLSRTVEWLFGGIVVMPAQIVRTGLWSVVS